MAEHSPRIARGFELFTSPAPKKVINFLSRIIAENARAFRRAPAASGAWTD